MSKRRVTQSAIRKVQLSIFAISVLAIGGLATSAAFTDQATTTVNVTAGTIDLTANGTKQHAVDLGANWTPGMGEGSTIYLENNGTIPMKVNARVSHIEGGLGDVLSMVYDDGVNIPVNLPLTDALGYETLGTITINPGESVGIILSFVWMDSGNHAVDNAYQGKTDTITFTFSATNV